VEYGDPVATTGANTDTGPLTVEVHAHPDAAVEAGWATALAAGDDPAPVFHHGAYLRAYHAAPLADIARFGYLIARDGDGRPVTAVPVALLRDPDPLGQLPVTGPALFSHVWHCYDARLAGVATPETATAVLAAMHRLARDWGARWYGFVNVARGSPTAAALTGAGWSGAHLVDRFTADLDGLAGLPDYLARIPIRGRANLVRTARRAAEHGLVTTVGPPGDADLDEIAALCAATSARFVGGAFYPPETFARFVTTLGAEAHVLRIRQRGRLVAVGVCLTDSARFHTWTCGVDYTVEGNASPYPVLFAESMALALRLGRRIFEGGRGNATFKLRHGLTPRPLDAYVRPV
jgi:hypothetical protein